MTDSEATIFALRMFEQCLAYSHPGLPFNRYQKMVMEDGSLKEGSVHGVMVIAIWDAPTEMSVSYTVYTTDHVTWSLGSCEIVTTQPTEQMWSYGCQLDGDVLTIKDTMCIRRRDTALRKSILAFLRDLGGNSHAVKRRIEQFGFEPTEQGWLDLVSDIFGVTIKVDKSSEKPVYRIFTHRPNGDLAFRLRDDELPAPFQVGLMLP